MTHETQRNATVLRRETIALPADRPTKLRCITIMIPDSDEYLPGLAGALALLGKWNSWERTGTTAGAEVASLWKVALAEGITNCGTGKKTIIYEDDSNMPFRTDCDCETFVPCPDGGEQKLATAHDVDTAIRGLPHEQATQPRPDGGCETYHKNITGKEHSLIPAPVSTGDTITISNWSGASNNHGNPDWYCGDGGQYFGGKCTGFNHTDGAAYMPGVPVGALIVNINGTYYDGRSVITVPGGVSNAQPFVLLNYNPATDLSGTLTFDVEVCNNQLGEWTHVFDFTLAPGPWIADTSADGGAAAGVWSAGVGWTGSDVAFSSVPYRLLDIHCVTAIPGLTSVETVGSYTCGGLTVEHGYEVKVNATVEQSVVGCLPNGPIDQFISFAPIASADLHVFSNVCAAGACPSGNVIYSKTTLKGVGVNPF